MLHRERNGLGHLGLCLDEMIAEVEDQLAHLEIVRALAQLDAREAQGEVLTVICATSLRRSLERQIAGHRLTIARRQLAELQRVFDVAPPVASSSAIPTAIAPAAPVADLAAYRAERAQPASVTVPTTSTTSTTRSTRRLGGTLAMLALLAVSALGTLSYVGQAVRLPGFDISVTTTSTPSSVSRVDMVTGY